MDNLTKEEIQEIERIYRRFCGDGLILNDFELGIIKKLQNIIKNHDVLNIQKSACGCPTSNFYCSTCNIPLTTNLVVIST